MFKMNNQSAKFYRLDYRPPSDILKNGIQGTNSEWINNIFGSNTIFASKSLKGISRFYLESVMNRPIPLTINPIANEMEPNIADPSWATSAHASVPKRVGPLDRLRHLYPENSKCYIYEIEAKISDVIDVSKDLNDIISSKNKNSRLFKFRCSLEKESLDASLEDIHFSIKFALHLYYHNCAKYTEEILIRGPIKPNKIRLYQTL